MFSKYIGSWMAGIPGEFSMSLESDLLEYRARKLWRVVTVQQPPFMEWNKTLGRYEGFSYDMLIDMMKYLE